MSVELTAESFKKALEAKRSAAQLKKYETYFPPEKRGADTFIGVRMGEIFKLAKEYMRAAAC